MKRNLQTIILAAGFGKRTKGILGNLPKILIKTSDGKTILDHLAEDLIFNCKQSQIYLITNSLFYKTIKNHLHLHFPNNNIFVLDNLIRNIKQRRGALGDLLFSVEKLKYKRDLLVLPSDTAYWNSFSIKDLLDYSKKNENHFITVVRDVNDRNIIKNRFGCPVLNAKNEIIEFVEKPLHPASTLVATPFYIYRKKHIKLLKTYAQKEGRLDSPGNFIPYLIQNKETVKAFIVNNKIIDAGVPEDIGRVKKYLSFPYKSNLNVVD